MYQYYKELLKDVGIDDGFIWQKSLEKARNITGTKDDLKDTVFWYNENLGVLIKDVVYEKMLQQYLCVEEVFEKICIDLEMQNNKDKGIPPYDTFNNSIIISSSSFDKWLERYSRMNLEIRKIKRSCKNVYEEINSSLCYNI